MSARDPIGELLLLARGAAEAGADWSSRLRREWLPRTIAATPRSALAASLAGWSGEVPDDAADLATLIEGAVVEAMAEQGYD
jgi:hypothetical protein